MGGCLLGLLCFVFIDVCLFGCCLFCLFVFSAGLLVEVWGLLIFWFVWDESLRLDLRLFVMLYVLGGLFCWCEFCLFS